jgi:SAM-dependent methyltransferase
MYELKPDLILYKDKISLIASNNLNSFEKLRMVNDTVIDLFDKILKGNPLTDSEKEVAKEWHRNEPRLFISKIDEKQKTLKIIKSLKKENLAYQKVKNKDAVLSYHQNEINNTEIQFDFNETTLSHMFRDKSKALSNNSYGESLCEVLINFKKTTKELRILEVGCGTGFVALNILNRIQEHSDELYQNVNYTMFDLSPTMAETQKEQCSMHLDRLSFLSGNIEEYDFTQQYDLIILNEVIADLNVDVGCKENSLRSEAELLVEKFDLEISHFPKKYILNTEAIKLVEKLKAVLAKEGTAFISEYGSLDEVPKPVELPGHNEYSINFGHLTKVWSESSFAFEFGRVGDLLCFDPNYEVLDENVRELLVDYVLPFLGVKTVPRKSYDKDLLRDVNPDFFEKMIHIPFSKLNTGRGTLSPYAFKYILLRK